MYIYAMRFVLLMCKLTSCSSVLCLFKVVGYVYDSECDVVSSEYEEPTTSFMRRSVLIHSVCGIQ